MSNVLVNINDSFRLYPPPPEATIRGEVTFELAVEGGITLTVVVAYVENDTETYVEEIIVPKVKARGLRNVTVNITTKRSRHDGQHAIRISVNISGSALTGNLAASSIVKLIHGGRLIEHSKTENITGFRDV